MIFQFLNLVLENDFFKQTSSTVDYAQGHLTVFEMNISFLSPKTILVAPRSKLLFYIRIKNPETKIGYVPRLKLTQGIYLGDTIVENTSGRAYLNVVSTLDEETSSNSDSVLKTIK